MNEQELLQAQQELATKQEEFNKQKSTSSEILRKMSSEFKVNLFEAGEVDKFLTSINEKNTTIETYKQKETEWATKQTEWQTQSELFTKEKQDYQTKIDALGMGFSLDNLEEALALAKVNMKEGQTIADGLKVVKEKFGKMFITNVGIIHNNNNNPQFKTEEEKYAESSPAMKAWKNQNKK